LAAYLKVLDISIEQVESQLFYTKWKKPLDYVSRGFLLD
jgi:hypothetical protein